MTSPNLQTTALLIFDPTERPHLSALPGHPLRLHLCPEMSVEFSVTLPPAEVASWLRELRDQAESLAGIVERRGMGGAA